MKMTNDDYTTLKSRIDNYLSDYHLGDTKAKNPMRYRWDLYHLTNSHELRLHNYLNDNHIDTALRKITGTK